MGRPLALRDGTEQNLIYVADVPKLPDAAGIYVLGRRWGSDFEALYVGKANRIRGRVNGQLNNLVVSDGKHPKRFIPRKMYVEKSKGE
jgi:hypothetical protein